tara:strand:+ start:1562 stop:2392 length:831 start_codon:yes stop_codon:yes gene_type:complete
VTTRNDIRKTEQLIAKLENSASIEKLKKRKAETRRKIEFGGLVVKAEMDSYSKDIILGALSHAMSLIENDDSYLTLFEEIGENLFMEQALIPMSDDIEYIKSEIAERKKTQELEKLKTELYELNLKSKHELSEFEGGLKQEDTQKILKSKSRKQYMIDLVMNGFLSMMSPRPVARNLLAVGLIFFSVFCLLNFLHIKQIDNFKIYCAYFIEIAAAIQILKSSTRSLFIPIIATLFGAVASNIIGEGQMLMMHHQLFFQALMVTGIIGIAVSVFTID